MPVTTTLDVTCDRCAAELRASSNEEVVASGWNFVTFNASQKRYTGVLCSTCTLAFFKYAKL